MSQLIRLDDRAKVLEGVFKQNMGALSKVVPRTMGDPSRLLRIAYNNIAYDTALLECSSTPAGMASIFGGVMECLKLGLTIGGPMQEAWLIPFRDNKQGGVKIATVIIGYQGFRNILDRSKSVIDLHPVAVHQNDEFDFELGSRPFVKHKPSLTDRGALIAVYAVAHLPRGGIQIEVMGKAEVDEHRAKSRNANGTLWVDFYEAAALKTVVRKISKYLPKSSEILARALDLDERADRGADQTLDMEGLVFDLSVPVGGVKQVGGTKLDALKQQLGAGVPTKATPEGEGLGGTSEDIRREREPATIEGTIGLVADETGAGLTAEQLRIMNERAEIASMTDRMKRQESAGAIPVGPATEKLFPSDQPLDIGFASAPGQPIGEEAAKKLMESIRAGKKGRA
jgi:recombination protein RecT